MKKNSLIIWIPILLIGCKSQEKSITDQVATPKLEDSDSKVLIAFGSCNKHDKQNVFWDDILLANPDVFIWGGDNIYADTEDMAQMERMYQQQKAIPEYAALDEKVHITGTWDDHDYGVNDGGVEFPKKKESQQLFLDFMEVGKDDPRRNRDGVYSAELISKPEGAVKIINLDTRFFRTPLTDNKGEGARYLPNAYGDGTILGAEQWKWLEKELSNSGADFNFIVTSIQFLSNEHGFEKWANHPHEIDKMLDIIKKSGAKGVIFLSGDRHISEFSKMESDGLSYPILDFTSSGLTHSYDSYQGEPNPYRVGEVVATTSFGWVEIDLRAKVAHFKIMGENGEVYRELKQPY